MLGRAMFQHSFCLWYMDVFRYIIILNNYCLEVHTSVLMYMYNLISCNQWSRVGYNLYKSVTQCLLWYILFKEAPYSFLKCRKHTFQIQNLVHWSFVRRMKLTVWYRTAFWESETATKKCVTVVAMVTKTFQNGC